MKYYDISSFYVSNGVKPGDIFSPVVFNVYIDNLCTAFNDSVISRNIDSYIIIYKIIT